MNKKITHREWLTCVYLISLIILFLIVQDSVPEPDPVNGCNMYFGKVWEEAEKLPATGTVIVRKNLEILKPMIEKMPERVGRTLYVIQTWVGSYDINRSPESLAKSLKRIRKEMEKF